jgi:hypothetical protein
MTPPSDELRELWNCDAGGSTCGTAELLRHVETVARGFERTIRFRDLRESAAGVLVAAIFVWLAWHDRSALERAAHVWLAACGVWIVYYLRRYSQAARRPAAEQSLVAYQRELLERYDRQIGLLRGAKYWYILPFWAGLVCSAAAVWVRTGNLIGCGMLVAMATAMNAGLWWLNEGVGVRYLRRKRGELIALMGSDGACG